MKRDEFKRKLFDLGNNLIDTYFPNDLTLANRVINNTAKYIFKNKIGEFDKIINLFANETGEIDVADFVEYMSVNMIGDEGLKINLRDYIDGESSLSWMVPDKTLVITKDDMKAFLS